MDNIEKEIFDGYRIIGACVLNDDYMALLAEKTPRHPEFNNKKQDYSSISFIVYDLDSKWGSMELDGYSDDGQFWVEPKIVSTIKNEFLVADEQGLVLYFGVGDNKRFLDNVSGEKKIAYLTNLAYIDGEVYGCGRARQLFKKTVEGDWEKNAEADKTTGIENKALGGFDAIDGFSQNEIYCVGYEQDVLLFNGKDWRALDITDGRFDCTSVHCGEDGLVYIGFMDGRVARGRGDQWEVTKAEDSIKTPIKTITHFKGRTFIGMEFGTYVLNDDLSFTSYDFDGELKFHGGDFIHSAYGCMIVANSRFKQVAFHDGKQWLNIKDANKRRRPR